jgi:hypothetical protein
MRIEIQKAVICIAVLLFSSNCSYAFSDPDGKDSTIFNREIQLGLNISTMGIGGSVTKNLASRLDLRLNGSYLGYNYDVHKLKIELQGNARLNVGTIGLNVDYYIFRFLYLSGGFSYNLTNVTVHALKAESMNVGDIVLNPQDIGTVEVVITPCSKFDPYLGGGFSFRRDRKLSFGLEFGLFFQGAPKVKLKATGMLEPTASREQEKIIEKNISPLIYYPNISLRLSYCIRL